MEIYEFKYPVQCALFPPPDAQIGKSAAESAEKDPEMHQMLAITEFL